MDYISSCSCFKQQFFNFFKRHSIFETTVVWLSYQMSKVSAIMAPVQIRKYDPCDIFRMENIAIPLSYFSIGFAESFLTTPLNIYMVNVLNAEPPIQSTMTILQTLPWSMKLLFGFISDAVPIAGAHRKPYLVMGSILYSGAFILYSLVAAHSTSFLAACIFMGTVGLIQMDVMTDTMVVERSKFEKEAVRGQMQASCYAIRFGGSVVGAVLGAGVCNQETWGWGLDYKQVSFVNGLVPFLIVAPFLFQLKEKYRKKPKSNSPFTSGLDLAAVLEAETAQCAQEKAAEEAEEQALLRRAEGGGKRVQFQSMEISAGDVETRVRGQKQQQLSQGYGAMDDVDVGLLDPPEEDGYQFSLRSNPTEYDVVEATNDPIRQQLNEIWSTVQLRAVWRPMAFVYVFNLLQVPNVAWQSYLQLSLHFPSWILGLTVTVGSFMTFAGVLAYKYLFFKATWRSIYIYSVVLTTFFALMQLVLVFQVNVRYGISNYFFSMGDDVIQAYISGIQTLPICVMYMRLCPEGAEGSSYAMLTTFGNIAIVVSSNLGNALAGVWDVSNDAMRENDVSGLWKLTLLTSCMSLLPLALLDLLPHTAREQEELGKSQERSVTGGVCFLSVLFVSVTYSFYAAIVQVDSSA